jgi:hypothetical protein
VREWARRRDHGMCLAEIGGIGAHTLCSPNSPNPVGTKYME